MNITLINKITRQYSNGMSILAHFSRQPHGRFSSLKRKESADVFTHVSLLIGTQFYLTKYDRLSNAYSAVYIRYGGVFRLLIGTSDVILSDVVQRLLFSLQSDNRRFGYDEFCEGHNLLVVRCGKEHHLTIVW